MYCVWSLRLTLSLGFSYKNYLLYPKYSLLLFVIVGRHNDSISYIADVPKELRLGAMQAVVLLMPDENREALQTLLLFLNDVAQESSVNQVISWCS